MPRSLAKALSSSVQCGQITNLWDFECSNVGESEKTYGISKNLQLFRDDVYTFARLYYVL